ncbi:hypothetical protein B0J13DRAFT_637726 [Dactylonectria estremocensis]|uniref:CHAT domain-containing protein n=1 Tax=Dactylonectria estremocensis TaxID=1079267 RepID=A0A9P9J1W6_9HYPO|nr:hypothetical protein B0J13DRAFT_637726 [Dactylonectria estremocensis]
MEERLEISLQIVSQAAVDGGWIVDVLKNGATVQRNIRLTDPLTSEEKATCRWYLQKYAQKYPFSVEKAAKAEALLSKYPLQLLRQLPLRMAVLSHLKDGAYSINPVTLSIDIHQLDNGDKGQPECGVNQLFWETLEYEGLWSHPNWHVVVRRCMRHQQRDSMSRTERMGSWVKDDVSQTLNVLLVIARDLKDDPSAYEDASPSIAMKTLLKMRDMLNQRKQGIKLNIEIARPGTFQSFKEHLQNAENVHGPGYFHIVHFDMHGKVLTQSGTATKYGLLYFADPDSGKTSPVPGLNIAKILKLHQVRFAVINSCESAKESYGVDANIARQFLNHGLQSVIGMSFKIASSAVAIFLERFYKQLLFEGDSFSASAAGGRRALRENPMRPTRYGSQSHLNDYFVVVAYDREHALPPFSRKFDWIQRSVSGLDSKLVENHDRATSNCSSVSNTSPSTLLDWASGTHCQPQLPLVEESLTGRDFELLRLEKRILQSRILYVSGMAGVGKTAFLKHVAFIWRSTHFVQAVAHIDFSEEIINSRGDLSEKMLRQLLPQVQDTRYGMALWSIKSRSLFSYDNDELDQTIVDILSSVNAVILLENIEPAPLPLAFNVTPTQEVSLLVQRLLCLAQDGDRSTSLYVILTHRRSSPRVLEELLNHKLGSVCYKLGGLRLPDALELSRGILRAAGEPVDEWKSEDSDWLESIIHLLQGIPSALLDILPLQKARGIPWRQFFSRLQNGLFVSRAELKQYRLEDCAASRELNLTVFPRSHFYLLCLISMFWHQSVPMQSLIKIFYATADDSLKREFQHGRGSGLKFWFQLFYGFVVDRGFIREDQDGTFLSVHPMFTIVGRAYLSDYINLSNKVLLKTLVGMSMEVCFCHPSPRHTEFQVNLFNLLVALDSCLLEVPANGWPLAVFGSSMNREFKKMPPGLQAHLLEKQFKLLEEIPYKFPLIEDKIHHLNLYSISLISFCTGENHKSSLKWKRICGLAAKGHTLVELLGPNDAPETVNMCRGFLLAASIVSSAVLGDFEEVRRNCEDLQFLEEELKLPSLPPFEHCKLDDPGLLLALGVIEPGASGTDWNIGDLAVRKFMLATVLVSAKYLLEMRERDALPPVEVLDKEVELQQKLEQVFILDNMDKHLGAGLNSVETLLELILFNHDSVPPVPSFEPDAQQNLADLESADDAGNWMDTCGKHLAMALSALRRDQFGEAQNHLQSFQSLAEMASAPSSLISALRSCRQRVFRANIGYLCHITILPRRYFDRGYGYGYVRGVDRSLHLGSIDENFWVSQALIWPSKEYGNDNSSPSNWWQWWEWFQESQAQDKSWIAHVRGNLGKYVHEARLMDKIFIFTGHNEFKQALSVLAELELACNGTVFVQFPVRISPLHSVRDCLELALGQSLVTRKLASWHESMQDVETYRSFIDELDGLHPKFCTWFSDKLVEGLRFAAERLELLDYQIQMRQKAPSAEPAHLQELYEKLVSDIERGAFGRQDVDDLLTIRAQNLRLLLDRARMDRRWQDGITFCNEYMILSQNCTSEYPRALDGWISARQHCQWMIVHDALDKAETDLDFDECIRLLDEKVKMAEEQKATPGMSRMVFFFIGPRSLAFIRQAYLDHCLSCVQENRVVVGQRDCVSMCIAKRRLAPPQSLLQILSRPRTSIIKCTPTVQGNDKFARCRNLAWMTLINPVLSQGQDLPYQQRCFLQLPLASQSHGKSAHGRQCSKALLAKNALRFLKSVPHQAFRLVEFPLTPERIAEIHHLRYGMMMLASTDLLSHL